ncbi:multifunctional CCA addition/repair protein [Photobacterium damselae]|uniref:multifunctional CCA addition/repair protein n=1 Tax=Photobacterium damselae TaxID=38293 RepID=UPI001EEDBE60|nr:multifunctional CCA addition/repair protein [Photobacterium damselae]UKA04989.1 multifunctional CCA addition/repair protein [Photobacterium damselae subsp. damselae]
MTKQTFLVGGAVRDQILGLQPKDEDFVVVGYTQAEMLSNGFTQVGNDFPVFLHPENGNEYALARQERKVAGGYNGFVFDASETITIEEDLLRRDLTINAIAKDIATGEIVDPYNGCQDIEDRVLRHVSNAYREDPVRVLRTARFLARYDRLGFKIADETLQLMREISRSGELEHLTAERIWQEFESALSTPKPSVFFNCLHEVGALAVILPELDALWGIPQPKKYHPEICSGIHTMLTVDKCASLTSDTATIFAALMHDLGKAATHPDTLPAHIGHEDAGAKIVEKVCKRIKTPRKVRELSVIFTKYHTHIHYTLEMKASSILRLLKALDARRRPERLKELVIAAKSDHQGRYGFEETDYPQLKILLDCAKSVAEVDLSIFDFSTSKGRAHAHEAQLKAIRKVTSQK